MDWQKLLSSDRAYMKKRQAQGDENDRAARPVTDLRNEFEKDYHRIIGSASFRRLQDKTQVFPLDRSDFVRTRLTHTLEVSSFANSLGQSIARSISENIKDPDFKDEYKSYINNILLCAGLLHDIGNPPFGHFGETSVRNWFEKNLSELRFYGVPLSNVLTEQMREDFYHFEGNAQALRLVTKLHFLIGDKGMNLTKAILGTIIKYPIASNEAGHPGKYKKMGYFYADRDIFEDIEESLGLGGCRHPLTFILEAADDIAYRTADIEDAVKKGCISYRELLSELRAVEKERAAGNERYSQQVDKLEELYGRALREGISGPELYAVQNWIVNTQGKFISAAICGFTAHYNEIMEGSYREDLFFGTDMEPLVWALGDIAYRYVFTSKPIYKLEIAAEVIISNLLDKFINAVLYFDTDEHSKERLLEELKDETLLEGLEEKKDSGDKNEKRPGMSAVDEKLISLISENYMNVYKRCSEGKSESEKLYLRLMLVTDYICGMTDSFAKTLYQELNAVI